MGVDANAATSAAMATPAKWLVICCEVAGKKTGGAVTREELEPAMRALSIPMEIKYTEYKAHATELAREYGEKGYGIIAVGGDGTIHEVMNGLLECKKLDQVPLGLLSQGTVNGYSISAGLPEAGELATKIAQRSFRSGGLIHISDNGEGSAPRHCFEAVYIGLGYNGARGAEAWRNSWLGPMPGIIKANFADNLSPAGMAVTGTMDLVLKNGERLQVKEETYYWIIVTMRNPYNGVLGDSMWVSYMTLADFPGFGRMVGEFLAPPFEFYSGLTACFSGHYEVQSFSWNQSSPSNVRCCLDGDATDLGTVMVAKYCPSAWLIAADATYPAAVKPQFIKSGAQTPCAAAWLEKNPPPERKRPRRRAGFGAGVASRASRFQPGRRAVVSVGCGNVWLPRTSCPFRGTSRYRSS